MICRSNMGKGDRFRLPVDMIAELLHRLPAKSLLRFKCVSKTWFVTIRSPTLINQHLNHNKNNYNYSLITLGLNGNQADHILLLDNEKVFASLRLSYPFNLYSSLGYVRIVGTCNGLVCIQISSQLFFVWNPVTKMVRHLREAKLKEGRRAIPTCQFAFLSSTNDYKLVRFHFLLHGQHHIKRVISAPVEVFTLSTDLWTVIEPEILQPCYIGPLDIAVNGSFYWMGCDSYDPAIIPFEASFLLCFDARVDDFRQIKFPLFSDVDGAGKHKSKQLVAFKESLAMFVFPTYFGMDTCFDVWIMVDSFSSGRNDTWTKQFSVGPMPIRHSMPLGFGVNGEIAFYVSDQALVFLYDRHSNTIKDGSDIYCRGDNLFVQSLVEIPGGRPVRSCVNF